MYLQISLSQNKASNQSDTVLKIGFNIFCGLKNILRIGASLWGVWKVCTRGKLKMEMTSYAVLFCDPNSDVRKEDGPVCRKSGLLTTILLFYCWSCCIDTILSTARPQIPPHINSSFHDARACRGFIWTWTCIEINPCPRSYAWSPKVYFALTVVPWMHTLSPCGTWVAF